jgi:hypothetical protein
LISLLSKRIRARDIVSAANLLRQLRGFQASSSKAFVTLAFVIVTFPFSTQRSMCATWRL